MNKLRGVDIVFFDAVGTLFGVNGSVGEIYGRIASNYGSSCDAEVIEQNFRRVFPKQPPLAFAPCQSPENLHKLEFEWWKKLVSEVFAGHRILRFDEFFSEVYEFFRRRDAWRLFDDVLPTLDSLKSAGLRMAVISNFDSRLDDLIVSIGLDGYFEAIHISSRIGAAKPDPEIFSAALRFHGIEPRRALFVGDSWREDILGARAAGITAYLLDRNGSGEDEFHITCLDELISN